jgi:hypothetical protein
VSEITAQSTIEEVAAIVSDALESAGITATLSGGSAVTIYSNNQYLSRDQAIMVAVDQDIDWGALRTWFENEGESDDEFQRFRESVRSRQDRQADAL